MTDPQPAKGRRASRPARPKPQIDPTPLPGTHLHRRRTPEGRPVCPVYQGPGDLAAACREAELHDCPGVTYGGETYVRLEGKWYPLRLI